MKLTLLYGNILTNGFGRFVALKGVSLDNPHFEEHPDFRKLKPGEVPVESICNEEYTTPWYVWLLVGVVFGCLM